MLSLPNLVSKDALYGLTHASNEQLTVGVARIIPKAATNYPANGGRITNLTRGEKEMDNTLIELKGITPFQPSETSVPRETASQTKSKKEQATTGNTGTTAPESQNNALVDVMNQINGKLRSDNARINYQVDKDTKTVVFQLIKDDTGEVIRQVPPDEILKMAKNLAKVSEGYFVNTKV